MNCPKFFSVWKRLLKGILITKESRLCLAESSCFQCASPGEFNRIILFNQLNVILVQSDAPLLFKLAACLLCSFIRVRFFGPHLLHFTTLPSPRSSGDFISVGEFRCLIDYTGVLEDSTK